MLGKICYQKNSQLQKKTPQIFWSFFFYFAGFFLISDLFMCLFRSQTKIFNRTSGLERSWKETSRLSSQKLLMSSSSANKDVVLTQMEVLQPELKASLTKTEKLSGVNCSQQCSGCSTTVPEWRQIRSRRSLLRQASQVRSCGQVPDLLTLSNINWLKVG